MIKNLKLVKQPPLPNVQYSIISSRDICSSTDFREEAPFSTAMFLSNSIEVRHTWAEKINKERESGASAKARRVWARRQPWNQRKVEQWDASSWFLWETFCIKLLISQCAVLCGGWGEGRKEKKTFYTWRISCQRRYSGFVPFVLLINTEAKLPLQKCCWVRLPPRERAILEVDHSWNLIQVCAAERGKKSLPIWITA